jgi:rubrerythrin
VKLDSVDKILDFAIEKEQEASDFYKDLGAKMDRPSMKDVFIGFSKEELGHKAKLQAVKDGKKLNLPEKKVMDLKIGDYLAYQEPSGDMDYQQALIVAMKAEKAAYTLYTSLAEATDNAEIQALFQVLAQEEAKHKLRFEIEYDDVILKQN